MPLLIKWSFYVKTNRILVSDLDSAMEIRNGSSEEQAAVKTVLEEGDTSLPPARCAHYNKIYFFNRPLIIFRVGATGELAFELHSLSGLLKEVGCEVTNSKYFSRESGRCDSEIGRDRPLCFWHFDRFPFSNSISNTTANIWAQTHILQMPRNWTDLSGPRTGETSPEFPLGRAE